MHTQIENDARAWVNDFRSGLSDRQLMDKYCFSPQGLALIMTQALRMGILSASEFCNRSGGLSEPVQLMESRRFSRIIIDFKLFARIVRQDRVKGTVTDICERGFQVAGVPAKVGKTCELEIVTDWRSKEPSVFARAVCRWSRRQNGVRAQKAGFELIEVMEGDFSRLLEDVSPIYLSPVKLSHLQGGTELTQAFTESDVASAPKPFSEIAGRSAKYSRARFLKFLNILPLPCLLIDRVGHIIHINDYAAGIDRLMCQLIGRAFSSVFFACEGPVDVHSAARTKTFVQATLRIAGIRLSCRLELRLLGDPDRAHVLVFLNPSLTDVKSGTCRACYTQASCPREPYGGRSVESARIAQSPIICPPVGREKRSIDGETSHPTSESTTGVQGPQMHSERVPVNEPENPVPHTECEAVSSSKPVEGTRSEAMREVLEKCRVVAKTDGIVLLLGESGSGKDYLARFIHEHSSRSIAPFRSVNCAAIPEHLAESELFGHEEGAFTGAIFPKKGMFELAPGGTLLLNEIGELSLAIQAKLLTVLDTGRFFRVGGQTEVAADSRILVATNRDLKEEVKVGRFRADLFHRLNVVPIRVPPLRDRIEDLPSLVEELRADLSRRLGLSAVPTVDRKTMNTLRAYHWPGNVRELISRLERSLGLSSGKKISLALMFNQQSHDHWDLNLSFPMGGNLNHFKSDVLRRLIAEALVRAGGKRQEAAGLLGITRYSLKRHMTNLGFMTD